MWFFEACEKDKNFNFKSSHTEPTAHFEKIFIFITIKQLIDKSYEIDNAKKTN